MVPDAGVARFCMTVRMREFYASAHLHTSCRTVNKDLLQYLCFSFSLNVICILVKTWSNKTTYTALMSFQRTSVFFFLSFEHLKLDP